MFFNNTLNKKFRGWLFLMPGIIFMIIFLGSPIYLIHKKYSFLREFICNIKNNNNIFNNNNLNNKSIFYHIKMTKENKQMFINIIIQSDLNNEMKNYIKHNINLYLQDFHKDYKINVKNNSMQIGPIFIDKDCDMIKHLVNEVMNNVDSKKK